MPARYAKQSHAAGGPGRRAAGKAARIHREKDRMTDKDRDTEQHRAGGEGR